MFVKSRSLASQTCTGKPMFYGHQQLGQAMSHYGTFCLCVGGEFPPSGQPRLHDLHSDLDAGPYFRALSVNPYPSDHRTSNRGQLRQFYRVSSVSPLPRTR